MVTLDEFEQVQNIFRQKARPRAQLHNFAYTGLIRCGECGFSVTAEEKLNRYGYYYSYYRCTKRRLDYRCRQPYISALELERQILAFLESLSLPDGVCDWVVSKFDRLAEEEKITQAAQQENLERTHAALATELDNLTKLRIRDLITDDEFIKQRREIENNQYRVSQSLAALTKGIAQFEPSRDFIWFSNRLVFWFKEGDSQIKRAIVQIAGSNLVLTNKIINIDVNKPLRRWSKKNVRTELRAAVEDVRTFPRNGQMLSMLQGMRSLVELHGEKGRSIKRAA